MNRRRFLAYTLLGGIAAAVPVIARTEGKTRPMETPPVDAREITLFLCGDVMTGRGIDQILPHPGQPQLFESYMRSALGYVALAERASGPIERPVGFAYIWGDALAEFERRRPDARIVNLETAVTRREAAWPGKGIHYRMHPDNAPCLSAAGIDCCVLANNHVLDWGREGLVETLETLHRSGIRTAGAGRNATEAAAPAILAVPNKGRIIIFAFGMESSGVPADWAAGPDRPGVNFLPDLSAHSLQAIADQVRAVKRPGDLAVTSIHWGGNWGFDIPQAQRHFARGLIDAAGVDVVHGHSSHHVKGIEVYRGKPILYGCGDFLNDYEGIGRYEAFRDDLALMYFPTLDLASGRLKRMPLVPTRTRRFRVNRAPEDGVHWLLETLNREGRPLGTQLARQRDNTLMLRWE